MSLAILNLKVAAVADMLIAECGARQVFRYKDRAGRLQCRLELEERPGVKAVLFVAACWPS